MNSAPKPLLRNSVSSSSFKRSRVISSRAPNGSSNRNIVGSITSERASEARMRMPPESCLGYFVSNPESPTSSIASVTRASRAAFGTLPSSANRATFARTVRHCRSVASWKT